MGHSANKDKDLIYLFNYGDTSDTEQYTSSWCKLYINQMSGKLITRSFYNSFAGSFHPGCISTYDSETTYDEMKQILAREGKLDGSKFLSLFEDNWEEWLILHKYV